MKANGSIRALLGLSFLYSSLSKLGSGGAGVMTERGASTGALCNAGADADADAGAGDDEETGTELSRGSRFESCEPFGKMTDGAEELLSGEEGGLKRTDGAVLSSVSEVLWEEEEEEVLPERVFPAEVLSAGAVLAGLVGAAARAGYLRSKAVSALRGAAAFGCFFAMDETQSRASSVRPALSPASNTAS